LKNGVKSYFMKKIERITATAYEQGLFFGKQGMGFWYVDVTIGVEAVRHNYICYLSKEEAEEIVKRINYGQPEI